jgi:hypothetical protein
MKTIALVIGNNDYPGRLKLDNAINDASAISDVFQRLGYQVIYKENCTSSDYGDLLTTFEQGMANVDASIFYFAGHGFEFNGENFLTSIESPLDNPTIHSCNRTCMRMTEITDIVKRSNTKVNIIIIDACRSSFDRGASTSFAQINAPEGTIIAFSTSPGDGAKDAGFEGHSLYTGALLQYIGRELLSVEELFKKTRKTVYNLSGGSQTSWEHTSLVGDFYFNTGQLVHSIDIPYDEVAVKDRHFVAKGDEIDTIIEDLASCNWNSQNPAMLKLRGIDTTSIDKNRKFILGRNILQSSKYAFEAESFIENLTSNLRPFNEDGENDVLNGILFEIYFDNNGDFRRGKFKNYHIDEIFKLRYNEVFDKSFAFIGDALAPYQNEIYYIPSKNSTMIDVDIFARTNISKDVFGAAQEIQIIESIVIGGKDITKSIQMTCGYQNDYFHLKNVISDFLVAPLDVVNFNSNISISKFEFIDET